MASMWESVFFTLAISAAVLFFIVSLLKEKKEEPGADANKSSSKKKKKSKKKSAKEKNGRSTSQGKVEDRSGKEAEGVGANVKPGKETMVERRGVGSKAESEKTTSRTSAKSAPIKDVEPASFAAAVKQSSPQETHVPVDQTDEFIHVGMHKDSSQDDIDFWALPKDKGFDRMKSQTKSQDRQQNDFFASVQSEDGWEVVKSSKGSRKSSFTSGKDRPGTGVKKGADESTKKQRESQRKRERERQKKELLRMEAQKNGLHQVWS